VTKRHWILAFTVVGVLAVGLFIVLVRQLMPPTAEPAALDNEQAALAVRLLDHLDAGRWTDAHAMFDTSVAAALDAAKLEEIWLALPKQFGGAPQRGEPRGGRIDGLAITVIPLHYPNMTLDVLVSTDAEDRVTGFRLVPGKADAAPPPAADSGLVERDITVAGLPGTLTLPAGEGPFPAVVLVHGSGPHDRDETIGPNKPFRDIAHGLAQRGVVVLRHEKRTLERPQDFDSGDYTVDDETVDDAVAAVAVLRSETQVDGARVFVLGHSLGALMAPRIGQRAPEVAGLILLAAPARRLDEILPAQLRYLADLDGTRSEQETRMIADADAAAAAVLALRDGEPTSTLPLNLPARYWRDLLDYDPVAVAGTLTQPMLILQGGRDYQVTMEDFDRWRVAFNDTPRATLQLYPSLNHLFASGSGPAGPDEYMQPAAVDSRPITDIAEWIHARH